MLRCVTGARVEMVVAGIRKIADHLTPEPVTGGQDG
jgi:hypothetical protein